MHFSVYAFKDCCTESNTFKSVSLCMTIYVCVEMLQDGNNLKRVEVSIKIVGLSF